MRLVIPERTPSAFIYVNEITDESIIGVEWGSGRRVMIVEDDNGSFRALGRRLSIRYTHCYYSKKECVKGALEGERGTVYEFTTPEELFEWISEGK